MRRISERFDFEREFARKGELRDFDIPRPIEIIPPDAIYTSPPKEPILGPVVLPKPPPELRGMIGWPPPEYVTKAPPAIRLYPPTGIEAKAQISPPEKNFLDRFFDFLNKILSGK